MKRISKATINKPGQRFVRRRTIVIIASIALALGIAAYVALSLRAWDTQDTIAQQSRAQLKEDITTNLLGDTASGSNNERISAIVTPYEAETKGKNICQLDWAFEWQSKLWFTSDRRSSCLAIGDAAQNVVEALKALRSTNESLTSTNASLTGAIAAAQASKSYSETATIWKDAATAIATKEGSVKSVTTVITSISSDITAAYTALDIANKNQDKAAFNAATTSLAAAYARLAEIKTAGTEARKPFITAVTDAFATL
jgi:hypothetical protein